jgi:hypothetical protein
MGLREWPMDATAIGSFGNGCSSLGQLKNGNGQNMKKDN